MSAPEFPPAYRPVSSSREQNLDIRLRTKRPDGLISGPTVMILPGLRPDKDPPPESIDRLLRAELSKSVVHDTIAVSYGQKVDYDHRAAVGELTSMIREQISLSPTDLVIYGYSFGGSLGLCFAQEMVRDPIPNLNLAGMFLISPCFSIENARFGIIKLLKNLPETVGVNLLHLAYVAKSLVTKEKVSVQARRPFKRIIGLPPSADLSKIADRTAIHLAITTGDKVVDSKETWRVIQEVQPNQSKISSTLVPLRDPLGHFLLPKELYLVLQEGLVPFAATHFGSESTGE